MPYCGRLNGRSVTMWTAYDSRTYGRIRRRALREKIRLKKSTLIGKDELAEFTHTSKGARCNGCETSARKPSALSAQMNSAFSM